MAMLPMESPVKMTSYTVRSGDTLWKISRQCGTTVNAIVRANNIKDANKIYPKQVLKIPTHTHTSTNNTNNKSNKNSIHGKSVQPIIDSKYYINMADFSDFYTIKLGASNDTVKSSGCYICSIGTIICWYLKDSSSNTKISILKQMAKNCNANGCYLNVPIKYNNKTFTIERIPDMAAKLFNGYPSICYVKGSANSGGGHFVVVNGYDSNKNGFESYIVLDPGRRCAKTLQDVMNRYSQTIISRTFIRQV